jgi:hypothetical protein
VPQEYKVHSGEENPKPPFKALLNVLLKTVYLREPVLLQEAVEEVAEELNIPRLEVILAYFKYKDLVRLEIDPQCRKPVLSLRPSGLKQLFKGGMIDR